MRDEQVTFAELGSLLNRLPGVSVTASDPLPTTYSMTLAIDTTESAGVVVYCANAANMPVEIYSKAPSKPIEERSSPAHLRYRVSSKISQDGRAAALDRFAMFGNFLIWHLHGTDRLNAGEANRLLTLWGGKHVAA